MEQVLIKEKKYNGRYVALKDYGISNVIADGKSPQEAYEAAVKNGCDDPVIVYVPVEGMVVHDHYVDGLFFHHLDRLLTVSGK